MLISSASSASVGGVFTSSRWNDQVQAPLNALIKPPLVRVSRSAAQEIPNAAWTAVNWDVEGYDTDGIFSSASNSSRLTVQTNGVYQMDGYVDMDGSTVGIRGVRLLLNDSTATTLATHLHPALGVAEALTVSAQGALTTGDYIVAQVYQNSGTTNSLTIVNGSPILAMAWLGRTT